MTMRSSVATLADEALASEARGALRDVPGFPRPGILFKDITPLLGDADLFRRCTEALADRFRGERVTHVVGIESRGFIIGAPIAQHLSAGFVPVRKLGRLPAATVTQEYELEYGRDCVQVHRDAFASANDPRVLIVDDVLATGGTVAATIELVSQLRVTVVGVAFLLVISALRAQQESRIRGIPTFAIAAV